MDSGREKWNGRPVRVLSQGLTDPDPDPDPDRTRFRGISRHTLDLDAGEGRRAAEWGLQAVQDRVRQYHLERRGEPPFFHPVLARPPARHPHPRVAV